MATSRGVPLRDLWSNNASDPMREPAFQGPNSTPSTPWQPWRCAFWQRRVVVTRTRLTKRGGSLLLALLAGLAVIALRHWHGFLVIESPVTQPAGLIFEGWGSDRAAEQTLPIVRQLAPQYVWTTGGPLERGHYLLAYHDYAHVAEATLERLGLPVDQVSAVPSPPVQTDRTLASVQALRPVLEAAAAAGMPRKVLIVTAAHHSRRTLRVYRRVLGAGWEIGLQALPPDEYDPARWWASSAGLKVVVGETASLIFDFLR
jgi:DUF218 domain